MAVSSDGSIGLGFVIGLVFGIIGCLFTLMMGGAETKKGAFFGLLAQLVLGIVVGAALSSGA